LVASQPISVPEKTWPLARKELTNGEIGDDPMTTAHVPVQAVQDPVQQQAAATVPPDVAPILGAWRNANSRTWGICRAELTQRDGTVWLHLWATDPVREESFDWGEAPIHTLYTDGPHSGRVHGYAAAFDLGHADTLVHANIAHGVTVFVAFTRFTDGSGRLNYMSREFFVRG
jgi:hypothetical protein